MRCFLRSALRLAAFGGETEGGPESEKLPDPEPVLKDGPNTASRQRGINAPRPTRFTDRLIEI